MKNTKAVPDNAAPQVKKSRVPLLNCRHKSLGQNLVEFALGLPLLLLLIFGIIDLARVIQAQVTVNNAARQAVRFAITGEQLKDAGGNYIARETTIISKAVASLAGLPRTTTNDPKEFGFYTVEINSAAGPGDPGGPNEVVEVKVSYNVNLLTPLVNAVLPRVLVKGWEQSINEEWGAVQSFEHANLPPLPPPLPTWTPIPTPTPTYTWTPIPPPTNTPTNTSTSTSTNTPTNTSTATNTRTATSTRTNTATVTSTRTSTSTSTGTSTPVPPSATSTRTNTTGPTATSTRTFTPVPTATSTSTRTNTAGPPTSTSTRTNTSVPTATSTSTRTATATATPIRRLVITSLHLKKRAGNGGTLDIGIDLADDLGNKIDGATVTSTGSWSGTLPNVGGNPGLYGYCKQGSYNDPPSNVTVTISASKANYQSVSISGSATSGYDPLCGP